MAQLKELIVNGASRLLNTLNVDGNATFGETVSTKKITVGANGPTSGDNGVAIQSSEHLLLYSNDNPKKGLWIGAGANLYLSYGRNQGDTSADNLIIRHDATEIARFDKDNNFIVKNNLIVNGQVSEINLIAPKIYNSSAINPRYRYLYFYNQSNTSLGHIRYDSGHATNIATGQFSFREYSPNNPIDATTTGKRESYNLPAVDVGLTADKDYNILTTKNLITITQGGTGASTAAGALQNLMSNTSIGNASTPIYWNGSNFTLAENTLGIYYEALNVQSLDIGTDGIIPAPGAYYINSKIQASDAAEEYGTILTLGGTNATNRYYTGQLLISSPSGIETPHLRIRRVIGSEIAKRRWSDWSILLDNNNYTDYIAISTDKITSGLLPVERGGTGLGSILANRLITGNGTNSLNVTPLTVQKVIALPETLMPIEAGWRRVCKITTTETGTYLNCLIGINGGYSTGKPTVALIHACVVHGEQAILSLLSCTSVGTYISKVRLVHSSGQQYWIDIYNKGREKKDTDAADAHMADQYLTFFGNVKISDIQNSINIYSTAATPKAELELKLVTGISITDANIATTSEYGIVKLNNSVTSESTELAATAKAVKTAYDKAVDAYSSTTFRTANTVLAAPNGSDGKATFRALEAEDIPSLNVSKITSGTLPIARGGTGTNSATGHRLIWTDANGLYYVTGNYHYADGTHIAVNSNIMPSANFYVNGTSLLNGDTNIQGNLSVTGNVTLNNSTLIEDLTVSSLIVNGQAIFNNGLIGNLTGTATKVSHKLKIGTKEFDGSGEVTIPIYNGETS